ncbi:MFS transporter [Corynebacterium oculi]|uniref:Major Facilitator Superfamily protein n=1 Tax=Corynebacterium oculi TaxID=1544416 RepID=A0A0Q1ACH9_9CORY|nr:MFS transporter [Corynebacterium oculi]KQB84344.1 Major Facilitator Superfamily protein [Corynebacterium oculi]
MSAAQARSSVLSTAGSPVAGWLYALAAAVPFALRAVLDTAFVLMVRAIHVDLGPRGSGVPRRTRRWGVVLSFAEGWRHLRSRPELFRLLLCAPLLNLTVFGTMSWVVYQLTRDGYNPAVVGLTSAGFAVGGALGAMIAPALTDRVRAGAVVIVGLGFSVAVLSAMYVVPRDPWLLMALAALSMILSPALNGALFGYVFSATGEQLQSRVMATFSILGGLATTLAPILASQAVAHGQSRLLGAALGIIGAAGVAWIASSPQVRRLAL